MDANLEKEDQKKLVAGITSFLDSHCMILRITLGLQITLNDDYFSSP